MDVITFLKMKNPDIFSCIDFSTFGGYFSAFFWEWGHLVFVLFAWSYNVIIYHIFSHFLLVCSKFSPLYDFFFAFLYFSPDSEVQILWLCLRVAIVEQEIFHAHQAFLLHFIRIGDIEDMFIAVIWLCQ